MSARIPPTLDPGYCAEVDTVNSTEWNRLLQEFDDANIYQTWAYAEVISGRRNMSQVVLKRDGVVSAIAQARIAKIPFLKAGIAYVLWGPLWRRCGAEESLAVFRQMLRAMRAEFVSRRGLSLRLFPALFDQDASAILPILEEEGFSAAENDSRSRTILMDLSPSCEELREGMKAHWKRELKVAEKSRLQIQAGSDEQLFDEFIEIYREMVARKHFAEPNDINQFRQIQTGLPDALKMKVQLCKNGEQVCSGVIASVMGRKAVYLFGATSNAGMKSRGSYLLQWEFLQQLKQAGIAVYDLNGINPEKNPGTYKFKSDLAGSAGTDTYFLGRFEAPGSLLSRMCIQGGETLRSQMRRAQELVRSARLGKFRPNLAGEAKT